MNIIRIRIVRGMRVCGRRGGVRVIRGVVLIMMVIRVRGSGIGSCRVDREIGLLNSIVSLYCIVRS